MKTQKSLPSTKQQKPTLKNLIKASLRDFDSKCIHDFRIEIKKLKAAMKLIHTVDASFDYKKKFKTIRQTYKDLGAIREIQLMQERFRASDNVFKPNLRKKITQILDEELKESQAFVMGNFDNSIIKSLVKVKKQVAKALKDLSSKDFKSYFKKRARQLEKQLGTLDISEKNMHDLRTFLKELKLNARYEKKIAKKSLDKTDVKLSDLDDLQKWLGQWNDNVSLKQKLKELENALNPHNNENEAILQFKTTLEVENCLIKRKVEKALKMDYV